MVLPEKRAHAVTVPNYFFNIRNSEEVEDFEGCECSDLEAARGRAILEVRALAADDVKSGTLNLNHSIEVKDERGDTVFVVTFRDAIAVIG